MTSRASISDKMGSDQRSINLYANDGNGEIRNKLAQEIYILSIF